MKVKKSTLAGFVVLLVIVVGAYFFINSGEAQSSVSGNEIREIVLDAKRFEYSQPVIEINKGERVKIRVNNLDTIHGISVPGYEVSGEDSVEFTADKTGEFSFRCAVMCGAGHSEMMGKIVVR